MENMDKNIQGADESENAPPEQPSEPLALPEETLKNRYKIESLIASGEKGNVYSGQDIILKRPVAIKMLHARFTNNEEHVARFKREAELASALAHANIVTVFDFGLSKDGIPYIVMDLFEGISLKKLMDKKGKLSLDETLDIFIQLADALVHTHNRGVIHRDLKPNNIMLQARPEQDRITKAEAHDMYTVKLVDFGIAKFAERFKESPDLTHSGTILGSALYMSPEQARGEPLDFRGDIYSFGCLLFHALSGSPPYTADNAVDCMNMHVTDTIPDITDALPDVELPEELVEIIGRCLEKDPGKRFQSADQLRASLDKLSSRLSAPSIETAEITTSEAESERDTSPKQPEEESPDLKAQTREKQLKAVLAMTISSGVLLLIPFVYDMRIEGQDKRAVSEESPKNFIDRDSESSAVLDRKKTQLTAKIDSQIAKASVYLEAKEFEKAEEIAQSAYRAALSLGEEDQRIDLCLQTLARAFEGKGNVKGALLAYKWSLSYREARYGTMAPQTTSVRARIKELEDMTNEPAREVVKESGESAEEN